MPFIFLQFRANYFSILRQFWVNFGSILGQFWVDFGSMGSWFWKTSGFKNFQEIFMVFNYGSARRCSIFSRFLARFRDLEDFEGLEDFVWGGDAPAWISSFGWTTLKMAGFVYRMSNSRSATRLIQTFRLLKRHLSYPSLCHYGAPNDHGTLNFLDESSVLWLGCMRWKFKSLGDHLG